MNIILKNDRNDKKPNVFHQVFSYFSKFRYPLLLFGLGIWILSPILGIIPLLLFSQIHISRLITKNKQKQNIFSLNYLSLFLVLFTITITASTYEVISDLQVYVQVYEGLGNQPFFEYMNVMGMEPVTFIIPNFIKLVFNGNAYSFILVQALTINLAFMLIAIRFLPSYYPTIILLNITSATYFIQMFLMRQFYALIFLVLFIYTFSLWQKVILALLAMLTHSSSFIFIAVGMITLPLSNNYTQVKFKLKAMSVLKRFLKNLIRNNFFLYGSFIFLIIGLPTFFVLVANSSTLRAIFPNLVSSVEHYEGLYNYSLGLTENLWKGVIFDICFLITSLTMIKFKDEYVYCYSWSITFLVNVIALFAFYYFLPAFGRLVFFLSGLSGFFYTIMFNSTKLTHKFNLFSSIIFMAIITKILYFSYRIIVGYRLSQYNLWSGNPLNANMFDYIQYLYAGLN
ncbi:EpsG family protein [Anabaenopsis sp. FSS-46]|uniref:EpsG family protein n=1 Tax=Anabaenopsis sp. FSS-46 TaxID=2971766 RepID=UPI00247369A6|nr:EpsG family protein [Anabaenopsis sp. FSS-46]MDH6099444.1 EpsG family protein [Anabaenopsis sp. FSS-46]